MNDVNFLVSLSERGWSEWERVHLEAQMLLHSSQDVCLDPSPSLYGLFNKHSLNHPCLQRSLPQLFIISLIIIIIIFIMALFLVYHNLTHHHFTIIIIFFLSSPPSSSSSSPSQHSEKMFTRSRAPETRDESPPPPLQPLPTHPQATTEQCQPDQKRQGEWSGR